MSRHTGRIQLLMLDHRDQRYYAGWEPLDEAHGYDVDLAYERVRLHVRRGRLRCGYSMWGDDCDRTGRCCQGNPSTLTRSGWRVHYVHTPPAAKLLRDIFGGE